MQYSSRLFRDFLHHFIAVPLNERTLFAIEGFSDCKGANYILTYCYCDPQYGLMLEVLSPAMETDGAFFYGEGNNSDSYHLYLYDYRDLDFGIVTDDGSIADHFWFKLALLREYDVISTILETRQMQYIDEYRCETYIDQLYVGYGRGNSVIDFYPTTIINYVSKNDPGVFIGRLDYEPEDDSLGVHKGEIVMFSYVEVDDVNICYCDIDRIQTARGHFSNGIDWGAEKQKHRDNDVEDGSPVGTVIDYMSSNEIYVACQSDPENETGLLPVVYQNNGKRSLYLYMREDDLRIPEGVDLITTMAADAIEIAGTHDLDPEAVILFIADDSRKVEVPRSNFGTLFRRTRSGKHPQTE